MSADFWAGYISGAAGIIVGNPLDLIKTRLQASGDTSIRATSPASLRNVFDRAGTLVRGTTAPVLTYGALNALLFVTYNRSLSLLSTYSPHTTYTNIYLAGVLGGLATFVVSTPSEIIKVRAQTAASSSTPSASSSSVEITKDIWRNQGVSGFYRGGTVTVLRDAIGYGFYFCAYEACKKFLANQTHDSKSEIVDLPAWKILLAGGIAGWISWTSIFPLDVIKTRVQSLPQPRISPPTSSSTSRATSPVPSTQTPLLASANVFPSPRPETYKSPSTIDVAIQAYRNEGAGVFFRGLTVCSVRAFIVNAVQWAVYEWTMRLLTAPTRR